MERESLSNPITEMRALDQHPEDKEKQEMIVNDASMEMTSKTSDQALSPISEKSMEDQTEEMSPPPGTVEDSFWTLPKVEVIARRRQSLIMERRGSFSTLRMNHSIRSLAGINALYICTQLHGASEQQSVNSDAQAELARMVNHHGWKDGVKPKFVGHRKK